MTGCLVSTREMQVLTEHVGRHERDAFPGNAKTALTIGIGILTDNRAGLDHGTPVDDGSTDSAVLADIDVRQDHGVLHRGKRVHAHV